MKLKFNYSPYSLELTQAIAFNGILETEKKGFTLNSFYNNQKLTAEVPVFKSMHNITLALTEITLQQIIKSLENEIINIEHIRPELPLFNLYPKLLNQLSSLPINCLFGLETLFLSLLEKTISINSQQVIKSNALYIPQKNHQVKEIVQNFIEQGREVVKIKIGRLPLKTEREILKDFIAYNQKKLKLRLDANQSFTPLQLEELLMGLDISDIEYIEEPYCERQSLSNFSKFPLGLDENLEYYLKNGHFPKKTKALIIKPSVILSLSGCLKLFKNFELKYYTIVISSCFEDPNGFKALNFLARLVDSARPTHHGLDTAKYLKKELKNHHQ